jgi:two-component system, LuxR family, sensor kinase FixL
VDVLRNQPQGLTPSERRFGSIIQASPVAMVMVGLDGGIGLFNAEAERIFGYTREEVLCQPMEMLMPERYRHRHLDLRAGYDHSPEARIMGAGRELIALRKDGSEFPVEIGLTPLEIEGDTWTLCAMVDISLRKQAEEALRESERRELMRRERLATLEKLAGSVAHEIRTPLCVIKNSVFFLEQYFPQNDATMREVLAEIRRAIANSDQIITEMLDYVREPTSKKCVFPIGDAISRALQSVQLPHTVRLQVNGGPAAIAVHANLDQVTRVLVNLIQNALQAMPRGGELEIGASREHGGKVSVMIRDTGSGIPEQDIAKIFDPLFSTKVRGIGLGLSIAQRYAQLNGGQLSVESQIGAGTTFRLVLSPAP